MAKELNKYTSNSDDFFSRLASNDSEGFDEFEKDALDGFASINDVELSKKIHSELDSKIHSKYIDTAKKKNVFYYLSLAAGLILVVGLSIFFYQFLNSEKQELALSKDKSTESLSESSSNIKVDDLERPLEEESLMDQNSQKSNDNFSSKTEGPEQYKELRRDEVIKEGKVTPKTDNDLQDSEADELVSNDAANVPIELASVPKLKSTEHTQPSSPSTKDYREEESKNKPADDKGMGNVNPRSTIPLGGLKKQASKEDAPRKKEKQKSESEPGYFNSELSAEPTMSQNVNVAGGTVPSNEKILNVREQYYFRHNEFSTAQTYLKVEFEKNYKLKSNIISFKSLLTVNESGQVIKVKFLTDLKNCSGCEKEIEKIILEMPNWTLQTKGKQQIELTYP